MITVEELRAQQQCSDAGCACQSDSDSANVHCVFPENHSNGDSTPSLSIFIGTEGSRKGKVSFKCHSSGCDPRDIERAVINGSAPAPAKDIPRKTRNVPAADDDGLTLRQLCEAKGLDEAFLEDLNVADEEWGGGTHLVSFPYHDANGKVVAHRRRFSLTGPDRFRWVKGDKPTLFGALGRGAVRHHRRGRDGCNHAAPTRNTGTGSARRSLVETSLGSTHCKP